MSRTNNIDNDNNTNKKRILIVHNYYQIPGGEDTVVTNEKGMLEDHEHKVFLYTRNNSELKNQNLVQKLLLPVNTIFSLKTYREVKQIIKKNHIDILHVHNTLNLISPSVYYAAFHSHIPVVQTMHNFRLLCPGAEFYRGGRICEDCTKCGKCGGLKNSLKHKCYRDSFLNTLASVITLKVHRFLGTYKKLNYICLTEFNQEKLLLLNNNKQKIIDANKIFVKPNFTVDVKTDIDTGKYKEPYFVYVGRLEKIKGIDLIVKAFYKSNLNLKVLGTGTEEDKLKKSITKHNIKNIELLGFVDSEEKEKIIAGSEAMIVAPQWYETFGMTVIEAFAHKKPVIVGDMGNAGGLVMNGKTGLKFQYDSSESLRKTLMQFEALSSQEKVRLGENAYEEYKKYYSKEINYLRLIEIYNESK